MLSHDRLTKTKRKYIHFQAEIAETQKSSSFQSQMAEIW